MLNINRDELVQISVSGDVAHPAYGRSPYRVSTDGEPRVLSSASGITYNIRVGDSATKWAADHVEPAVSIKNPKGDGHTGENAGLNVLACVGNEAKVVSGNAEGEKGVVTGKHGGAERVMVDFPREIMEKMLIGDTILIRAEGVGMQLLDHPAVKLFNLSPQLLSAWNIEEEGSTLRVPVTHRVPAAAMGSGLGQDNAHRGDYDITLFDDEVVKEYGLDSLRLGDLVAIVDADHSYGRIYRRGAVSIGIVIHGDSVVAGHGPGVTSLLAARNGEIEPVIDDSANIAQLMNLRDDL